MEKILEILPETMPILQTSSKKKKSKKRKPDENSFSPFFLEIQQFLKENKSVACMRHTCLCCKKVWMLKNMGNISSVENAADLHP